MQADHAAQRRTVLYVEDHPVNVTLMEALFARRPGLRLVVATDGRSAWRAVADLRPVLLLLDLGLPDCHGSSLLAALRRLPQTLATPAVAVTADDQFDVEAAGFCERWLKPLDLAAVLRRVDDLCMPGMAVAGVTLRRREIRYPGIQGGHFPFTSNGDHR